MADRLADVSGAGRLRNLLTGEQRTMPVTQPSETSCTPLWCRVVSLDGDGNQKIEVVRPDGSQRSLVARSAVSTVLPDVVSGVHRVRTPMRVVASNSAMPSRLSESR